MASTIPRRVGIANEMQSPDEVRRIFTERFLRRFGEWLTSSSGETAQDSVWPMRYPLATLNEGLAAASLGKAIEWVQTWHKAEADFPAGVTIHWVTRQWTKLGEQTMPVAVSVQSADVLAEWTGSAMRWRRACDRKEAFAAQINAFTHLSVWSRHCDLLADWLDVDFVRLQTLIAWLLANPASGLYLRQLPVPGLDTKWIETRKGVVRDFLLAASGKSILNSEQDFYLVCGLRKPASKLRLRILCPKLRESLCGLCDIEAPVEEIAQMALPIRGAFIVENLETGLALPDFEGMVAFMRLGHAVSELANITWLSPDHSQHTDKLNCLPHLIYWGDIDTHGLAILSRARGIFSRLNSVLMDEATFLRHNELWVTEKTPNRAIELKHLTSAERELYSGLRENKWGSNLRLEQERLPWAWCLDALQNFRI